MKSPVIERIDAVTSLQEYFMTLVGGALKNQNVNASKEAEFYLVNLLNHFLVLDSEKTAEEPLALMLARALEAETQTRIAILRRMGDVSLYVSGFFPQSLSRRLVDVSYYIQMGEIAYHSLSEIIKTPPLLKEIFRELSLGFIPFVDVLAEVSEHSRFQSSQDILHLYERWLKTGSGRTLEKLTELGLSPQALTRGKIKQ